MGERGRWTVSSGDPEVDTSAPAHGPDAATSETNDGAQVVPDAARTLFGARVDRAAAYVDFLAGPGLERGLMGPREAPRLWDRHVLNSAVLAELIPQGALVADVGSGAGLPGVPLAIARPDLEVVLIEPMLRRTEFLAEVVDALELDRVTIRRARAEDLDVTDRFDVVTARAVAPLTRLATWTLRLLRPGGRLLALKGRTVSEELAESAASLARMGAVSWTVEDVGHEFVDPPARVAVVERGRRRHEAKRRQRRK